MSDAKWRRALRALAVSNTGDRCEWKFIKPAPILGRIPSTEFISQRWVEPHHIDRYINPVLKYADVEWLELLKEIAWRSYPNAPMSRLPQDVQAARSALQRVGAFELEETGRGLRLYGYRR